MRILVLGAGAVGGYFFGRLQHVALPNQHDVDVTFLVRSGRAKQLQRDGLILQDPDGSIDTIPDILTLVSDGQSAAKDNEESPPNFDIIVIACKAFGLEGALDAIAKHVHPGVAILPLLNGMAHLERIQRRFPSADVWGGTCGIVASLDGQTGVIKRMTASQFVKAGVLPKSGANHQIPSPPDHMTTLMNLLQDAGIQASVSDNIVQAMWDKWTFLATLGAATCLMNATVGQILHTDYGQDFLWQLFQECESVAQAEGSMPDTDGSRRTQYGQFFTDKTSIIKASMCRDMESGGPTEADHLLGDLIQRAKGHAIATPLLSTAYARLQIHDAKRVNGNSQQS
jgi:2-dehydropantoate 2-reductase